MKSEICVFFSDNRRRRVKNLIWKVRKYIRICKWNDGYKNSGIRFNLIIGEIGRFHV
jgi:hypothetical protein